MAKKTSNVFGPKKILQQFSWSRRGGNKSEIVTHSPSLIFLMGEQRIPQMCRKKVSALNTIDGEDHLADSAIASVYLDLDR